MSRLLSLFPARSFCTGSGLKRSISFEDFRAIYQYKTTPELLRGFLILRLCGLSVFVDNSLSLMKQCQKVLGPRVFSVIARPTFYSQFVGGDSEIELQRTVDGLKKAGIRLMVCPVQEEDVDDVDTEASNFLDDARSKHDRNLDYIMHTAAIMAHCDSDRVPNLQVKVTALLPAIVVTQLTQRLNENPALKETLLNSFVHILAGKKADLAEIGEELERGLKRLKKLADYANKECLKLLVDAEYTYMKEGINLIAMAMMCHYNKQGILVGNTYQCYLKATYDTITQDYDLVASQGAKFGAKIVRGAYMEKERKLAARKARPDPINDTYEATGKMYDKVTHFLIEKAVNGEDLYVVVATHNEKSVLAAAAQLSKNSCPSGAIVFAQIFGMGEQITMPLGCGTHTNCSHIEMYLKIGLFSANEGFTVYKSVPFGPMEEVLPYLSRRVAENRSVLAGARKERELLTSELKRRLWFAQ